MARLMRKTRELLTLGHTRSNTTGDENASHSPEPLVPELPASTPSDDILLDAYTYNALDASRKQIRLVSIFRGKSYPWASAERDSFGCAISVFEAGKAPPYVALSYTWGSLKDTRTISINGRRLVVRENLYDFLETFSCNKHERHRYLWIDQMCIDQANTQERNHQVGMMADIYRNARYVIAWLDRSSYTTAYDIKQGYPDVWPGLSRRLLSNRYFSRLWIVQEVLLAKELHLVCGDVWIPWGHLRKTIQRHPTRVFEDLPAAKWLFMDKSEDAEPWHTEQEPHSLSDSMQLYSNLDCEDSRDKVYGLLGLLHSTQEAPEVDYDKSLQEVFLDAVRIILARLQPKIAKGYHTFLALVDIVRHVARCFVFSKRFTNALGLFLDDLFELGSRLSMVDGKHIPLSSRKPVIDTIGYKRSARGTLDYWWYEHRGKKSYYSRKGKLQHRERVEPRETPQTGPCNEEALQVMKETD